MGTLDPEAVGVLPLAVGKATRLISFIEGATKEYRGELVLGTATTTDDIHGVVTAEVDARYVTADMLQAVLPEFLGELQQVPPMYSAVKVQGKKLYEYARAGVELDLPPRDIVIYSLTLIDIKTVGPRTVATLVIKCGKGTYIRSLCRDIGARLGIPACMGSLERVASGPFRIEHSIALHELSSKSVISIVTMLDLVPKVTLSLDEAHRFVLGQRIAGVKAAIGSYAVFWDTVVLGIGNVDNSVLSPKKVLAQEGDIRDKVDVSEQY